MGVLDIIVKSVFVFLRNFGDRGIEASLAPVSMFLSFAALFTISYLVYQLGGSLIVITEWGIGALVIVCYFSLLKMFRHFYVHKSRQIRFKDQTEVFIFFILGVTYSVGAIFLLVLSLRYF